jgi:hypothetical protein
MRDRSDQGRDHQICSMNLDTIPPIRPDLPCEAQVRGWLLRNPRLDRTRVISSPQSFAVQTEMSRDT